MSALGRVLPVLLLLLHLASCGGSEPEGAHGRRVLVVGIDGMDHALTQQLIAEGRLPNFARLAATGSFSALETSIPPQSPVAWSEFFTGLDPGGHGIFDFLHRDPATMMPYLSTSTVEAPGRVLSLGNWRIPLSGGGMRLLVRGTPFWEVLEDHGVRTTIVRMPANFPPSGTAGRELSGMGTPDILGGYGTFSLVTTAPELAPQDLHGGGVLVPAEGEDGLYRATLRGPPNSFRADGDPLTADLTVITDPEHPVARIEIGDEVRLLNQGEWSDWIPFAFKLTPLGGRLPGMVRVYLQSVHPELILYITPINLDPYESALPIANPPEFAAELAEAGGGRYYTQGMPEDAKAFTSGVLNTGEFLAQAALARDEAARQYRALLQEFSSAPGDQLLFYYFGFLDQASHVLWHTMDPTHPAHDPVRDAPFAGALPGLYEFADSLIGETLEAVGDDALVVVMSDHGFRSWRRAFSLNAWLEEAGYLAVREEDPARRQSMDFLTNVDWTRTQAYGLGLSGLYLNLQGRELTGIVPESQRDLLLGEIARRLSRVLDPETGEPAVARVQRREDYESWGAPEVGPDLVVEFAGGVRNSDASAGGKVPAEIFTFNTSLWSGDHIMDHLAVPGVLFTNRPFLRPAASLRNLAAALTAEFGVTFPKPDSVAGGD
ncbi:MAG: alkaline phosphatase family protein [Gemmatimonadota bacterium]